MPCSKNASRNRRKLRFGHGTGRRRAEAALWRDAKAEKSREPADWEICVAKARFSLVRRSRIYALNKIADGMSQGNVCQGNEKNGFRPNNSLETVGDQALNRAMHKETRPNQRVLDQTGVWPNRC